MKRRIKTIIFLTGMIIGLILSDYTTVYRMSCDTTKYGWMWASKNRFDKEIFIDGHSCKDSHQEIVRETSLYMIYQVIKQEMGIYD